MPTYIVRIDDNDKQYYIEWSTVVDAPTSSGMQRDSFCAYYTAQYGHGEATHLQERLARADGPGRCSSLVGDTADSLIAVNRAGPEKTRLSKRQIIKRYCEKRC